MLGHAACHGDVDASAGRTPRTVMRMQAPDRSPVLVSEREIRAGPQVRALIVTACVAGQSFDDIHDGNPGGLVSGAMRAGIPTTGAFLAPVPDRVGLVFGVLVTLLQAEHGALPEAALERAQRLMAGRTGAGDLCADLCARLGTVLADAIAADVWAVISHPAFAGARTRVPRLGRASPLLDAELCREVVAAAPRTPDELHRLLSGLLARLPGTPGTAAETGVAAYGATIFSNAPAQIADMP